MAAAVPAELKRRRLGERPGGLRPDGGACQKAAMVLASSLRFRRPLPAAVAVAPMLVLLVAAAALGGCPRKDQTPELDRALLDRSIAAGRAFLLRHQTERGDFTYEYDVESDETTLGGSQVRQAGALWGLALLHQAEPTEETRKAIEKGLAFWEEHSEVDGARRWLVYPGEPVGSTGTVALTLLSLVDFLRAEQPIPERDRWSKMADELTQFLLTLRLENGHFHDRYALRTGRGIGDGNPYYDGEALLALVKTARYRDLDEAFRPVLLHSAETMFQDYVVEARKQEDDSPITKGFYQWGSMAFRELYDAGWDEGGRFARRTVDMAHWMIDVHRTLDRRKNTAYAQEGIATAYELAGRLGDEAAQKKFRRVIEKAMIKLTRWQIGGPIPNEYARQHADDGMAQGGEMNAKSDGVLRIDVTQHQMHAALLARRYLFDGP